MILLHIRHGTKSYMHNPPLARFRKSMYRVSCRINEGFFVIDKHIIMLVSSLVWPAEPQDTNSASAYNQLFKTTITPPRIATALSI